MVDIISPEQRSRVMSRIRGKNTTPERYIQVLLSASGLNFRQHDRSLPGCPDFTFPDDRTVVFVNGDFWHGWRFPVWKHKLAPFWQDKITATRRCDSRNYRKLKRLGWKVIRIWEHQVEQDALRCVAGLVRELKSDSVIWKSVEKEYRTLPPLKRRNRLPKP